MQQVVDGVLGPTSEPRVVFWDHEDVGVEGCDGCGPFFRVLVCELLHRGDEEGDDGFVVDGEVEVGDAEGGDIEVVGGAGFEDGGYP